MQIYMINNTDYTKMHNLNRPKEQGTKTRVLIIGVRDEFRSGGLKSLAQIFFHCLHENEVVLPEYCLNLCLKMAIWKILGGLEPPSAPAPLSPMGCTPMVLIQLCILPKTQVQKILHWIITVSLSPYCTVYAKIVQNTHTCTVEPCYKEVGYNKTLLKQGDFAGPSSLYFLVFLPWYIEKPDITR